MAIYISDQKFNRQIEHLTKHLPDQKELKGIGRGSNFYKQINDKSFVDAYKLTYKNISGLNTKFELTRTQQHKLSNIQDGLLNTVEKAFCHQDNPPANFENFINLKRKI